MTDADRARAAFEATVALHQRVAAGAIDAIVRAADAMGAALEGGGKVLACGNGGSATDAAHLATELVGRFRRTDRPALPAVALTTDGALLTSVANDFGYEAVFARQVEGLGRAGDVVVGITTSGASASVNVALARARDLGLRTIGLTGRDGGETGRLVDVHVNVPGDDTARIQEVHRTIVHIWCELIEARTGRMSAGRQAPSA